MIEPCEKCGSDIEGERRERAAISDGVVQVPGWYFSCPNVNCGHEWVAPDPADGESDYPRAAPTVRPAPARIASTPEPSEAVPEETVEEAEEDSSAEPIEEAEPVFRSRGFRAYLGNVIPRVDLPARIGDRVRLIRIASGPAMEDDQYWLDRRFEYALDLPDVADEEAPLLAASALLGIQIFSDCSVTVAGHSAERRQPRDVPDPPWGHYTLELESDALEFAERQLDMLLEYTTSETYTRVANALRFYSDGLRVHEADLGFLAFASVLESLFSDAGEDVPFRVSLRVAKFLGAGAAEQGEYFDDLQGLYQIRSRILQGDPPVGPEERDPNQLAADWTPRAGRFAQMALRRVIGDGLVDTFESPSEHATLMRSLLFAGGPEHAPDRS